MTLRLYVKPVSISPCSDWAIVSKFRRCTPWLPAFRVHL